MFKKLYFVLCIAICMPSYAVTCTSAQYIKDGLCAACIYNATCDGETYTCVDGFYDTGDNECAACPPNTTCTSPSDFTCKSGAYLNNGVCIVCPDNATCAGGDADFHCNAGWYKFGLQCKSCAGHICDGETVVSCGAGYYFNQNQCTKCSINTWYCPGGTATWGCKEGYYRLRSQNCYQCPEGYYCPQGGSDNTNYLQYCARGYYMSDGVCVQCDEDIECPGGKPANMTCSSGLYLWSNGQCLPYIEGDAGTAPNCNPGYYDNGIKCISCPIKKSTCSSATEYSCIKGYYKNNGACAVCPPYSVKCNDDFGVLCADGYYLKSGQCADCGGANYCNNNTEYKCPSITVDMYDSVLPKNHTIISLGNVYSLAHNASINSCMVSVIEISAPEGIYTKRSQTYLNGIYWNGGDVLWQSVAVGRYLSVYTSEGYKQNYPCTNGAENSHYTGAGTPGGNDCPWVCDDGFLRNGNQCTACPAGQICINGLLVCPLGQYAVGMSCSDCPIGYVGRAPDNIAPQSETECQIECPAGTYLANANGTVCAPVGENYWNGINYTYYGDIGARNQCPTGLRTGGFGAGADEYADCGRVLHVGQYSVHLRGEKRTLPALHVRTQDGNTFYGDMSTENRGHLRIKYNDQLYSVYNMDLD